MRDGIQNAHITSTMLGVEDHGILTAFLYLDYGGGSQGFGGYTLETTCAKFVRGVLKVTGAESWEKLPGMYVRVRKEKGLVVAIGHIVRDEWFEPAGMYSREK